LWPGYSVSQNSTQRLRPGAEFSNKSFPSIEIIVAEGKDKTEARKWESMEIAKRIKEIVDKGEIKITNKRERERNILYRDFAILFRSTTDIKLYENSLSHLDIPIAFRILIYRIMLLVEGGFIIRLRSRT
jgi:ATP-dependent exoDNAse (exonuclease V) beta subunit